MSIIYRRLFLEFVKNWITAQFMSHSHILWKFGFKLEAASNLEDIFSHVVFDGVYSTLSFAIRLNSVRERYKLTERWTDDTDDKFIDYGTDRISVMTQSASRGRTAVSSAALPSSMSWSWTHSRQVSCIYCQYNMFTLAGIPRRRDRHGHPREDSRRHVRHALFPEVISMASWTTRRHSRDGPREDVGEDIDVGRWRCGMPAFQIIRRQQSIGVANAVHTARHDSTRRSNRVAASRRWRCKQGIIILNMQCLIVDNIHTDTKKQKETKMKQWLQISSGWERCWREPD